MSEAQGARRNYMTPEHRSEVAEMAALLIARPERRVLLLEVFPHGAREVLWEVLDLLTAVLDGTTDRATARRTVEMMSELREMRTAVERGAVEYLAERGGERDE